MLNQKIKCIVVDDEPLAHRVIEKYAEDIPNIDIVFKCKDAIEAMQVIDEKSVDLIFLDINMPKISGINFLKTLKNPPLVIIATAYSEYAIEGFELDVTDYLMKPFSFERFLKAVQKVQEKLREKNKNMIEHEGNRIENIEDKYIFVKSNKKTYKLNLNEIFYIEALGDYVKVHTKDSFIITYQSMKKVEELLPSSQFVRIHKSFIVSIDRIISIEGNMVEIKDEKVPIGNNYKHEFQMIIEKKSIS